MLCYCCRDFEKMFKFQFVASLKAVLSQYYLCFLVVYSVVLDVVSPLAEWWVPIHSLLLEVVVVVSVVVSVSTVGVSNSKDP